MSIFRREYGVAPTFTADFTQGSIGGFTFTRASATGTYFDSAGLLQTAGSNAPRFDYSQTSVGTPLGLLMEENRTNVVLWNRDLTNAAWTASNITPLKNITGIDGVANSASRITATAGNGTILQAITLGSSARFQSVYVKRITGTGTIEMTMDNGATWTAITVTSTTLWSRVSIPTQTLANPTVGFRVVTSGDAIAVDYVQNETGASGRQATSPIATTTAGVARAADVCSLALTAFPWNNDAGSVYIEVDIQNVTGGVSYGAAGVGSAGRFIYFNNGSALIFDGSTTSATVNTTAANALARVASGFDVNGKSICLNGGTVVTSAFDGAFGASPTTLFIGDFASATAPLCGHVRRLAYYPRRLSDIQLQALTT